MCIAQRPRQRVTHVELIAGPRPAHIRFPLVERVHSSNTLGRILWSKSNLDFAKSQSMSRPSGGGCRGCRYLFGDQNFLWGMCYVTSHTRIEFAVSRVLSKPFKHSKSSVAVVYAGKFHHFPRHCQYGRVYHMQAPAPPSSRELQLQMISLAPRFRMLLQHLGLVSAYPRYEFFKS